MLVTKKKEKLAKLAKTQRKMTTENYEYNLENLPHTKTFSWKKKLAVLVEVGLYILLSCFSKRILS